MESKEEKLKRLKDMLSELDSLGKEEFLEIVRAKYGEGVANMVMSGGFDDYARTMMRNGLEKEVQELES